MQTVFFTRILDDAYKQYAKQHGLKVIDENFLEITYENNPETLSFNLHPKVPAVFTSQHAVKAFVELCQKHTLKFPEYCYTIDGITFKTAKEAGLNVLIKAPNALQLAQKIIQQPVKEIVFYCANISLPILTDTLLQHGTKVHQKIIYKKKILNKIIHQSFDAIVFFSPSQVEAFLQNNLLSPDIPVFCIGNTTANYFKQRQNNLLIIAQQPSVEVIIEEIKSFFDKKQSQ